MSFSTGPSNPDESIQETGKNINNKKIVNLATPDLKFFSIDVKPSPGFKWKVNPNPKQSGKLSAVSGIWIVMVMLW